MDAASAAVATTSASSTTTVTAATNALRPNPTPILKANGPPPFLSKTYDMVDDPSTDSIVCWSQMNNSFVVWNPPSLLGTFCPSILSTITSLASSGSLTLTSEKEDLRRFRQRVVVESR